MYKNIRMKHYFLQLKHANKNIDKNYAYLEMEIVGFKHILYNLAFEKQCMLDLFSTNVKFRTRNLVISLY